MSLYLAPSIKFISAVHYIKGQDPVPLGANEPFHGTAYEQVLECAGRTIFLLADDSMVVAELDPAERPPKRQRPVAPLPSSSSSLYGRDVVATPNSSAPQSSSLSSQNRHSHYNFELMWKYSPELARSDNARVLYVVDTGYGKHTGLGSNNMAYTCNVPGVKPSVGDWVLHGGRINSNWETAFLDKHEQACWYAKLLQNFFLSAAPAKAVPLPERGDISTGVYHTTVTAASKVAWGVALELANGCTVTLKGAALLMVNQIPEFLNDWSQSKGFARLKNVVLDGRFQTVSPCKYALRGTISFLVDYAEVKPHTGEFSDNVADVLGSLFE